nr:restriction endonuclease subunit S [uncultured Flavobacterium sp.]
MTAKQILQPKLRFPEFEGDWHIDTLGKLFNVSAGGDIKREFVSENRNDIFKYPIYANAEKNKGFYGYASIYKIDEEVITIAGRGVNIGIAHARKEKFYPIVRLLVLKPKKKVSVDFFEYAINKFDIVVESTGVPQLTAPQISNYEINYTNLEEQIKIANFLSSIDEKINLLKEKKALLEAYKKGMMQKIFNQEIRFKDDNGNDFEDWENVLLSDFTEVNKGTQLNKEDLHKNDLYPCISGGIEPSGYTNKFNRNEDTIIISEGGNSCGYVNFIKTKFWCGGHCYSIEILNDYEKLFIYHLLKYNQDVIMKLRVGSGLPNIQKKDLKVLPLILPVSFKEQTKIANFLSAIDEKIDLMSNQIKDTQEYKKGLLQQMFI